MKLQCEATVFQYLQFCNCELRFASQEGIKALTALETSQQLKSAFKLDKDQGRWERKMPCCRCRTVSQVRPAAVLAEGLQDREQLCRPADKMCKG